MSLTKVNYIDNETIITAQNLNDIQDNVIQNTQLIKKAAPWNLLDNSDFTNLVNQRRQTSYKGAVYGIDRWVMNKAGWMVTVEDGHIRISDNPDSTSTAVGMLQQFIPITPHLAGKVVTLAARVRGKDTRINIHNKEKPDGGGYDGISSYTADDEYHILTATTTVPTDEETFFVALQFRNATSTICEWIALYEGEYTIDTLPEYQPKGYEQELLICRQYDPTTGEYIGLRKFNQPRNLLDNSDFKNLVAQAGYLGLHGTNRYLADRWRDYTKDLVSYDEASRILTFANTGSPSILRQKISADITGKTVTLAIKASNITNKVYLSEQNAQSGHDDISILDGITLHTFVIGEDTAVLVWSSDGGSLCIDWIALYEGEYTIDTLPEYQPKGYSAELAECQRYYQYNNVIDIIKTSGNNFTMSYRHGMRINPTITLIQFEPYGKPTVTNFTNSSIITTENFLRYATLPTCSTYDAGALTLTLNADL